MKDGGRRLSCSPKESRKPYKSGWELVSPQINVRKEENVFLLSRDIGQVSRKNLTEILSNCAKEQRPSSFGTLAYLGTKPKSPHPGLSPPICSPVRSERRTGHTKKKKQIENPARLVKRYRDLFFLFFVVGKK